MKQKIAAILTDTLDLCFREGRLHEMPLPPFVIEIPNNPDHGDFATNLAMTIASSQKKNPREIAEVIIAHLIDKDHLISRAEIGGAGFINFFVATEQWHKELLEILKQANDYGRNNLGRDKKIMVEFVSANPTGPIHLGHGRGAALGDSLCRLLAFSGYNVHSEFYVNDGGQQIALLGESIYSRWKQRSDPSYPFPCDGYQGEYIQELTEEVANEKELNALSTDEAVELLSTRGKEQMLKEIQQCLSNFRVSFDLWFKESSLYSSGEINQMLQFLQDKGLIYENDGAVWMHTSLFGDDKDRVLKKNTGEFTYFATDIAYHLDKWKRGFNKVINIWGADHHGYVNRVQAALTAEGIPEGWLEVLLIQLVKLWEGGSEVKMSKRSGRYVTLQELVDAVGVDAVRFVFLSKDNNSPIDFDIDLARRKDSENPVYYVQYAHARICSVCRKAAERNLQLPDCPGSLLPELALEEETALIRKMAEFPSLIEEATAALQPHRLSYYLAELASSFHRYYNHHRIITKNENMSKARLSLALAIKIVIKNGLGLLGVSAPEAM
ncbi:MAG: arginine--tRNA ligase [Thermodesulfobacteriota bacterium]